MSDILIIRSKEIEDDRVRTEVETDGSINSIIKGAALGIAELMRTLENDSDGQCTSTEIYSEFTKLVLQDMYDNVR